MVATDKRVSDIALKYGYKNPEAFTKAFKRLHGVSPSALKKHNGKIKAFTKMSFQISIKGECKIIYRIVEKGDFKVFGDVYIQNGSLLLDLNKRRGHVLKKTFGMMKNRVDIDAKYGFL